MADDKGPLLWGVVFLFILIVVCLVAIGILVYRRIKRRKGDKYLQEESPLKDNENPVIRGGKSTINGAFADSSSKPNPDVTKSKRLQEKKPDIVPSRKESKEHAPEDYYNLADIPKASSPVKLGNLPDLVKRRNKEEHPFNDEFEKLVKDKDKSISWEYAEQEELKPQNRFKNIIPYDHSRVKLDKRANDRLSDYINASFINGYKKEKAFIACHGPVERTMPGVWRMIWEHEVPTIVMVTNFTEFATMKMNCEQYWPSNGTKQYGVVKVTMTSEEVYADFTIRNFSISHTEEPGSRSVRHYQYTSWPDHGVPTNIGSLLKVRRLAKQPKTATVPVMVHCRAGIGRTGTFIALDYLLDEAQDKGEIDILACVHAMRKQRINMVQTQVQYAFLYDALNDATLFGETSIGNMDFPSCCEKAMQGKLDKQFKLLEETKPVYPATEMEEARSLGNKDKNRDPKVLPSSRDRVFFVSMEDGSNPYFNAVPVKGYKAEVGYYATQVPLQATVDLFWKLVQEQEIKSIVCLQTSNDVKWFPQTKSDQVNAGNITVHCTDIKVRKDSNLHMHDMCLMTQTQEGAVYANMGGDAAATQANMEVKLFYEKDWADNPISSRSRSCLIDIRDEVLRWQGKDGKPVLVVCLNGADESGLYIASSYLTEMATSEHELDVAQVLKQIRITRPQFITNREQYKFLHLVMKDYLQSVSTYSNL